MTVTYTGKLYKPKFLIFCVFLETRSVVKGSSGDTQWLSGKARPSVLAVCLFYPNEVQSPVAQRCGGHPRPSSPAPEAQLAWGEPAGPRGKTWALVTAEGGGDAATTRQPVGPPCAPALQPVLCSRSPQRSTTFSGFHVCGHSEVLGLASVTWRDVLAHVLRCAAVWGLLPCVLTG